MANHKKAKKSDLFQELLDKFPTDVNFDLSTDINFTKKPKAMQEKFEKQYGWKPKPSYYHPVVINYSIKGFGFGELCFYRDGDVLHCSNEDLSKETIVFIMAKLVQKCVLDSPPRKNSKK